MKVSMWHYPQAPSCCSFPLTFIQIMFHFSSCFFSFKILLLNKAHFRCTSSKYTSVFLFCLPFLLVYFLQFPQAMFLLYYFTFSFVYQFSILVHLNFIHCYSTTSFRCFCLQDLTLIVTICYASQEKNEQWKARSESFLF